MIKVLYGLKQAPRAWYDSMDEHLRNQGFNNSSNEDTLYIKRSEESVELVVALYVDDLLITGIENDSLINFKL